MVNLVKIAGRAFEVIRFRNRTGRNDSENRNGPALEGVRARARRLLTFIDSMTRRADVESHTDVETDFETDRAGAERFFTFNWAKWPALFLHIHAVVRRRLAETRQIQSRANRDDNQQA